MRISPSRQSLKQLAEISTNRGAFFLKAAFIAAFSVAAFVDCFGQSPDTVVAMIDGQSITLGEIDELIAPKIYPLQQQIYALRSAALTNVIAAKILEAEAARRRISIEQLRRQMMAGEVSITKERVEDAYSQNAAFFATMSPDEAKERLRLDLETQDRMKLYKTALENLKKNSRITVGLSPPTAFLRLDDGLSPSKGAADPKVIIVEFSDFECPFCRSVQPTLGKVLETYGDSVRLVFKHLPLEGHRNSLPAARAAYCAGQQNRFWQYHDSLFATRDLSSKALEKIANDVGLNLEQFLTCLSSEQSRTFVVNDIQSARGLQIESTPSFVVNGTVVSGAIALSEFKRLIDLELSRRSSSKPSSMK